MMKIHVLLVLLYFAFNSFGQEAELYQIVPNWQLGDTRMVHTETKSTTYISDTVFTEVSVKTDYKITVVDTTDNYKIKYTAASESLGVDLTTNMDTVTNFIMKLIHSLEEMVLDFEYIVSFDKNQGLATKIENTDEFDSLMYNIIPKFIDEMSTMRKVSEEEKSVLKRQVYHYIDSVSPAMHQTVLNGINYIFQAHSYAFPWNDEINRETLVYDINALGTFGTTEFPVNINMKSQEIGNDLSIETITNYDKSFLLEQLKKKSPAMSELTIDDVKIKETDRVLFDLETTWIKEHESNIYFEIPKVKVIENTVIQFN